MASYKYLFERPVVDVRTAEKWMGFEQVLSKASRLKRLQLIRNTTLVTALVAASIFGVFYFMQQDSNRETMQNAGSPVIVDSLPSAMESEERNVPDNHPSKAEKATPMIVDERDGEPSPQRDTTSQASGVMKDQDAQFKIEESLPKESVFTQATPKTGFEKLFEYFYENTEYPEELKEEKIEGRVLVEFVVKQSGDIADVVVIHKLHPVLDSIAVMTVKNMPSWNPAAVNGRPVDTRHSIPLLFQVEK